MRVNWKQRCEYLESIILDIHWMARRYADGRMTYAPDKFNRAMIKAITLGIPLKKDIIVHPPSIFAQDGDERCRKDLSKGEPK